jgi:hypothetical protein
VNLGQVTPDERRVIGTFLITKIQLALPRRKQNNPFYLYVDEFDEFAASPYQTIITKLRKYNINLTIMNQGLYQIRDELNRRAVKSIDAKIIFRLDADDAHALRDDFFPDDPHFITTLPLYPQRPMAFYRSPVRSHLNRPYLLYTARPAPKPKSPYFDQILQDSRISQSCNTTAEGFELEDDIKPSGRPR